MTQKLVKEEEGSVGRGLVLYSLSLDHLPNWESVKTCYRKTLDSCLAQGDYSHGIQNQGQTSQATKGDS